MGEISDALWKYEKEAAKLVKGLTYKDPVTHKEIVDCDGCSFEEEMSSAAVNHLRTCDGRRKKQLAEYTGAKDNVSATLQKDVKGAKKENVSAATPGKSKGRGCGKKFSKK